MHSSIHIIFIYTLGDSDDSSTGVIVATLAGGTVGIISIAVTMILSLMLWHHCNRHNRGSTTGS